MSQALHETIDVHNAAFNIDDHQYPPQSVQNQGSQGLSNFVDGSGPIFSMYLEMATEEDKRMAENWKADADGILIFTGLFSAAVASLISVSIQDIRQNPQDTSNFYLANIYQATINPSLHNNSSSFPASPPPFSPPTYAVWVNGLWFLSLVISLTCALLATFLQQWARRYLKVTQSRYSLHKRARIRAFFSEGVEKCLLPWAVETLPTLLHISLFLFFSGLVVFLSNVNITIFKLVLSWVGVCTALYGCITLMPIFRHDSPYYTSLSSSAWHIAHGLAFVLSVVSGLLLYWTVFCRREAEWLFEVTRRCRQLFLQGMQKTVEETALKLPSEIDNRTFMWTFDCLDEDHELERFFSGLPGFCSSKVVDNPLPNLTAFQKWKLYDALTGLLDRTFSSDLLPDSVKKRRAMICAKAADPHITGSFRVFSRILFKHQYSGPLATEIMQIVKGWRKNKDKDATLCAQAIISMIVARVQPRDDSWFILASKALGVSEAVLRDYASKGDNLSLSILIHVVRQQLNHFGNYIWPTYDFLAVLEPASKFNIQDTSPELQNDFCTLWNQVVLKAQNKDPLIAVHILRPIRNLYIRLHEDTDCAPTQFSASTFDLDDILWRPSSYPSCNIPGHHPDSTTHIHDVSASTTISHAILHDNTALVTASLASIPIAPSLPVPSFLLFDENLVDVPLFDNNISVPAPIHPGHQTTTENLRGPTTSPDPVPASGTQQIETSARTTPSATFETPTHPSSVRSMGAFFFQNNIALMQSDTPKTPSSAFPELGLNNKLPAGSHCSISIKPSPGTPPRPTPAPVLCAGEGGPKVCLHEDKGDLDPPSVNRAIQANTMAVPDLPPESPSLTLATDIAITDPSQREPDAGHEGDHPPRASHSQHDSV